MATVVTTDPPEVEINIIQGSSKTLEVTVVDKAGAPVNLTGATCHFNVEEAAGDPAPGIISKSSSNPAQILITDAANGKFRIFIDPADTAPMAVGLYVCDIWVVLSTGKRHPVISPSEFEVKPRVTIL
jgi:hypothetical protein